MRPALNWLILFLSLVAMSIPTQADNGSRADAEKVLNRYFAALQSGDVEALQSLLGGELLEKRLRLLKNPTYPPYLRTTYQTTIFTIVESRFVAPNKVSIRAKYIFENQPPLYKNFLLIREDKIEDARFRIYSESTL
ncbi:MAG: hypothetical protein ACK2TV_02895 [Anaerolineales bacterium]